MNSNRNKLPNYENYNINRPSSGPEVQVYFNISLTTMLDYKSVGGCPDFIYSLIKVSPIHYCF